MWRWLWDCSVFPKRQLLGSVPKPFVVSYKKFFACSRNDEILESMLHTTVHDEHINFILRFSPNIPEIKFTFKGLKDAKIHKVPDKFQQIDNSKEITTNIYSCSGANTYGGGELNEINKNCYEHASTQKTSHFIKELQRIVHRRELFAIRAASSEAIYPANVYCWKESDFVASLFRYVQFWVRGWKLESNLRVDDGSRNCFAGGFLDE